MSNYIKKLIEQGEHQQLDFKFSITDSRKIARSLVAFANTEGGKLLVGVKDNGAIAGVRSDEEYYMIQAAAEVYSTPAVTFETRVWQVEGRTVLEIIIPKSEDPPHFVNEINNRLLSYVRVNDQNLLANSVMLKVWNKKKEKTTGTLIKFTVTEELLLNYLDSFQTITLSKFCRLAHIKRQQAEDILVNFILLDIIVIVFTEKLIYYRLNENFDKSNIEY